MVNLRVRPRQPLTPTRGTRMAPGTPKKSSKKATNGASPKTPDTPGSGFRIRKSQKLAPQLGTEMITVRVGSVSIRGFAVHKALLVASSGFFKAGLNSSFREANSGVFDLPEEDSELFSMFVTWLYFGRLFSKTDEDIEWNWLPKLYTLGERLDSPNFKDAVVSGLIEKVVETDSTPLDYAPYIWENTITDCSLRRLVVDFHVFALQGQLLKKGASIDADHAPAEFLQEVIARMAEVGKDLWESTELPWIVNACRYHEHAEPFCTQE